MLPHWLSQSEFWFLFLFLNVLRAWNLFSNKRNVESCWEKHDVINDFFVLYFLFYLFSFSILFPSHFPPGSAMVLYLSLLKQVRKTTHNKQSFFGLFHKGRSRRNRYFFFPPNISISKLFPSLLFGSDWGLQRIVTRVLNNCRIQT